MINVTMGEDYLCQPGTVKSQQTNVLFDLIDTPSCSGIDQDQFAEVYKINTAIAAVCHLRASDHVDAAMDFKRPAVISSQWAHARISFKLIFNFLRSSGVNPSH